MVSRLRDFSINLSCSCDRTSTSKKVVAMTLLSPHQRDELLELAQYIRIHAVDMKSWQYPGGGSKTLQCCIIGSVGACWASLHPEAYTFKEPTSDGVMEIVPFENPYHNDIVEFMPQHMGISEEEFQEIIGSPSVEDAARTIERLAND